MELSNNTVFGIDSWDFGLNAGQLSGNHSAVIGSITDDAPIFVLTIAASFFVFKTFFNFVWSASERYFPNSFGKFELKDKADWCSRANSQLHALVIVPGFFFSVLASEWADDSYPVDDRAFSILLIHIFMCVSVAYFAFDFVAIIKYRVPLWYVFAVHHIVASTPYLITLFHPTCQHATRELATYLLVEVCNLFMNVQVWLEMTGHAGCTLHTVMFYSSIASWATVRTYIPYVNFDALWNHILVSPKLANTPYCMIPSTCCAIIIQVFCLAVLLFVLVPDVIKRWKKQPAALPPMATITEASPLESSGRSVDRKNAIDWVNCCNVSPSTCSMGMSDDSSPTNSSRANTPQTSHEVKPPVIVDDYVGSTQMWYDQAVSF